MGTAGYRTGLLATDKAARVATARPARLQVVVARAFVRGAERSALEFAKVLKAWSFVTPHIEVGPSVALASQARARHAYGSAA